MADERGQPITGLKSGELGESVFLCGDPARVTRIAAGWSNVKDVCDVREKYPKCARSWKRRPDVGSDADYPDLSARDAVVMKELSEA